MNRRRAFVLFEERLQRENKKAVVATHFHQRVAAQRRSHGFATHLPQTGTEIRTMRELMGHTDVSITMVYTHAS